MRYVATVEVIVDARGLSDAAIRADGYLRDLPYELQHRIVGVGEAEAVRKSGDSTTPPGKENT